MFLLLAFDLRKQFIGLNGRFIQEQSTRKWGAAVSASLPLWTALKMAGPPLTLTTFSLFRGRLTPTQYREEEEEIILFATRAS